MSYRKEYLKIFKKITSIAQKGKEGVFEYYTYIDELIDNSQYGLLEDVMTGKFGINIRSFKSTDDFKRKTFDRVRSFSKSTAQQNLKNLFDKRNVYAIGFHFYDKINNHYLGDIKEVEEPQDWIAYKDPKLTEKQDQIKIINLEVTTGLPQSVIDSIPNFSPRANDVLNIQKDELVRFDNNIYECFISYTYSQATPIAPSDPNYWIQIYSPEYSFTLISDNNTELLKKYDEAISIVKSFIYLDSSSSDYMDSNYLDDYFI